MEPSTETQAIPEGVPSEESKEQPKDPRKEEDEKDETVELQNLDAEDHVVDSIYRQFPEDTCESFGKILALARDVNISVQPPEIVFIGKKGHGKTLLIESLLGIPLETLDSTKRPTLIQVTHAPYVEEPKLLPKSSEEGSQFRQIKIEWGYGGNFTLIDTPGLASDTNMEDDNGEGERSVLEIAKPNHRILCFVEEASDWESVEMIEFAKKIDIKLTRSFFVFTKLYSHLQKFSNPREALQFFSRRPSDAKSFFLSTFGRGTREKLNAETFPLRVSQAYIRDMNFLRGHKLDKKVEESLGIGGVRGYILELSWRSFKDCLPELRKQLQLSKKLANEHLRKLQNQYQGLDHSKMRSIVSNYVADWLQVVVQLIDGSTEGNPALNGQTLEEENVDQGEEWKETFEVQLSDAKVYGGQQFERLLSVFEHFGHQPEQNKITSEDISSVAAVGINGKQDLSQIAWIASHLVQQSIREQFSPLVEKLCTRGAYIMKRLADIAFMAMQNRSAGIKRMQSRRDLDDLHSLGGFPYFKSIVRDIFNDYVDKITTLCREKCETELSCSQLLYWELTSGQYKVPPHHNDKLIPEFTEKLLKDTRSNIIDNVLLKSHNFFLVQMQRDLSGEILKDISSFDEKLLEEIFELGKAKELLKSEEEKDRASLQELQEKEVQLRDVASQFSRLTLTK